MYVYVNTQGMYIEPYGDMAVYLRGIIIHVCTGRWMYVYVYMNTWGMYIEPYYNMDVS